LMGAAEKVRSTQQTKTLFEKELVKVLTGADFHDLI
jgi:hypothetical protein